MQKKRKRRLKKSVILLLFLVLLCLLFLFIFSKDVFKKKQDQEKTDYVTSILSICSKCSFDENFLKWVEKKYGSQVLEAVDKALKQDQYQDNIWHTLTGNSYFVLQDLYQNIYLGKDNVTIIDGVKDSIQIGYAGDISLADNWDIMPHYKSDGLSGILSNEIVDYMKNLDWMIVNNEFAFSERGVPMNGKLYTFRGTVKNVNIYHEMGVDMVTLANNHVYDYGQDAFFDTLVTLKEASLPYIGAGKNLEEATKPYYLIANGYKITFLNATRAEKYILTPGATEDSEGVFRAYDPSLLVSKIQQEKQNSDYVVVLIHWGTENTHQLEDVQKETGKLYIDSGADMIIGSHAHVLQGVEFYNEKLIAYNLGNFIFNDQSVDTGILTWNLDKEGQSTFFFLPGLQKNCYTSIVENKEASDLYERMTNWSIHAAFLEDGQIVEK